MICGFINENYEIEYKELSREQAQELCLEGMYFSINSDNEYYIFIKKEIYTEENTDKIMPLIAEINKKLLINNVKGN